MNTYKKTDRPRSMGLWMPGILFLANPIVSTFDVLPDFVGAILCLRALSGFRYISPYFAAAVRSLRIYLGVSLMKPLFSILSLVIYFNYPHQTTIFPLFSFSFTVVEWIVLFPAFFAFFRAAQLTEERCGPFASGFAGRIPALSRLTVLFFVVRGLCAFLPDFLFLSDDGAGESLSHLFPLFALLALIPALIFAYLFYTSMREFQKGFFGHKEVSSLFEGMLDAAAPRMATMRRISSLCLGWALVAAAALLTADLPINAVNILPDMLIPLCYFALLYLWRDHCPTPTMPIKLAILASFVLGLCADGAYTLFFSTHSYADLYYLEPRMEALPRYTAVFVIFALKCAADVFLLLQMKAPLMQMAMRPSCHDVDSSPIHRQRDRRLKKLRTIITVFVLSGIICAGLELLYMICNFFPTAYAASGEHVTGGQKILPLFDFLSPVLFAVNFARFLYMLWGYGRLTEDIQAEAHGIKPEDTTLCP